MTERKPYPSDLTDEQWRHLHILLPRKRGKGNHRSPQQKRELLNAILLGLSLLNGLKSRNTWVTEFSPEIFVQ
jgi:hypothetical protein